MLQPRSRRTQRRNHRRIFRRTRPDRRRLPQIMHQCPSRRGRLRVSHQPKSFQSRHAKMFLQNPRRVIRLEHPIIQTCLDRPQPVHLRRHLHGEKRRRPRQEHLPRPQNPQFIPQTCFHLITRKFRSAKLAGREIHERKSDRAIPSAPPTSPRSASARPGSSAHRRAPRHRRQIIIFLGVNQPRPASRPRRNHADHFSPHNLLARPRHFHLLADRHLVPRTNQPRDIILRRVIRHPAHRHRLPLFLVPRGQSDLQNLRRHHRVIVEKLVEIPQAEKQQGRRMLLLHRMILLHQWGCRFSHARKPPAANPVPRSLHTSRSSRS